MKDAMRKFCEAATYPPDNGHVDPAAVFTGEMIRGFWPAAKEVRWKPASIADLDKRVVLGCGGQVWYGATWIRADAATEIEFEFRSHPLTLLRWFLNGKKIFDAEIKTGAGQKRVATKQITLRAGWNEVVFRGYCLGYPPFRAGLGLNAPAEKLWPLQLSNTAPR